MDIREFKNKLGDFTIADSADYFNDNVLKDNAKFKRFETATYDKHFRNYVIHADHSIYSGSGGVALLKLLLSSKDSDEEKVLLLEARKLLPITKLYKKRFSFLCGDSGILAVAAVIEHRLGERDRANSIISRLVEMSSHMTDTKTDVANEVLYGRAGYLYSLLFVEREIGESTVPRDIIEKLFETIVSNGKREAKNLASPTQLMYTWHEKQYLGAAHGLCGILYQLLLAKEFDAHNEIHTSIRQTIDELMKMKLPSGNYPSSISNQSRDKLVQWCHGAPGFVYLFAQAYKVYGDEKYLTAAMECGECVWKRGLLTKGYSICHGVAGNGYTFLALFKLTGDKKHLFRAIKFAEWCIDYTSSHETCYPDRPLSLFEGIAGRLYFLIDVQDPGNAKFPGFEL